MKINTYEAGQLTTETLLPSTEDVIALAGKSVLAVDVLSDAMKIPENLNKIFFLRTNYKDYIGGCFYKLIDDEGTLTFVRTEDAVEVDTLPKLIKVLEDYPKYSNVLPEPGSAIEVEYIFDDKTYGTRAAVEANIDDLDIITTPWTILGYNKTIPQYVKYRCKVGNNFEYRYVSSIDDTSVTATVDGASKKIFIKHGWENANKIDENDCTGLLRPIVAGCKTYTRLDSSFGSTPTFAETNDIIASVSTAIVENVVAKDGRSHTYGNNNPYDCPSKITIAGKEYSFCGYTVTVQSQNLLTGKFNGSYLETAMFDAAEDKYAVAVNIYQSGKQYYKRNGLVFTAIAATAGNVIAEDEVYEYDSATSTMTCKSAYVQEFHSYGTELSGTASSGTEHLAGTVPAVGTLITDTSLSVENNNHWDGSKYSNMHGSNKWCQSNVRSFMNSDKGKSEFDDLVAFVPKNPFDKPTTTGFAAGNGLVLKFAKDPDFLKYVCPTVNRTAIPDKQYNTAGSNIRYRGSFVAYKQEENASITGSKINVSHNADKFFLLSYTEASWSATANADYDKLDATSTFSDIYPNDNTRKKYKYLSTGQLDSATSQWWTRSSNCSVSRAVGYSGTTGGLASSYAYNTSLAIKIAPACTLY